MSNSDNDKQSSFTSFSGYNMPLNITEELYEDVEPDVTRDCRNVSFEPFQFLPSSNILDVKNQPSFHDVEPTAIKGGNFKISTNSLILPLTIDDVGWKLDCAPALPDYYLLDDDSVFVENTSAKEIAVRLCEVLKELSIEATFDVVKAKARCVTLDHVDFRIFLYSGKGEYSNGIIVEVQRRDGSSLNFRSEVRGILDAALGKSLTHTPLNVLKREVPVDQFATDDYGASDAIASIQSASQLLKQEAYCSKLLALQILSSSTEPSKIGKNTAELISQALLDPSNEIGDLVISNCQTSEIEDSLSPLALSVLANALNAVPGKVCSRHRRALLPILIQYLEDATTSPRMAYFAARCLEPILRQESFSTSDVLSALRVAKRVGELKHNALSDQAKNCMSLINMVH